MRSPAASVLRALGERSGRDSAETEWRPTLFDPSRDADAEALGILLESGVVKFVHDTIDDQLRELVASRDPVQTWPRDELDRRVREHLGDRSPSTWGTWVHFSWSGRLVHVLPRDEYREVRTDRNRYKITREEQHRLASFRIGVIGLSVGNMVAITLALEGIGGSFKVADFDTLSLSNLNRLRGGVHELGVDKTVLACREMFEIDPYLDIRRYPEGVQPGTIDDFLISGGKLDLLVEECDDLYVKVVVRERARAHGIPVVMDTSDRGLLDIERFDREPDRPVMHGLIGSVKADELRGLETKDKVPFFLAIVDEQRMSTRMAASLPEIKHTVSSWPQLASAVALGGAITADVARRILLGEHTESGRYYVDPGSIVVDGKGLLREAVPPPRPFEIAPAALLAPELPPEPEEADSAGREMFRWLVALGTLAPSAHNAQPWRFVAREGGLECWHDPARDLPSLDFDHGATWVAFGALCENIDLAARHIGQRMALRILPEPSTPGLFVTLSFTKCPRESSALFGWITNRVTNRKRGARGHLPDPSMRDLVRACEEAGARLQLIDGGEQLDELGALMGACDRICLLNRDIHHDAMHGYRWTPEEVEMHRSGLDIATMELTPSERAGMRLMQQWRTPECLGQIGGGRALEDLAVKAMSGSSAAGLVTVEGVGPESYFRAGRGVQRMWLTAASLGIAIHPMTGLPYLFARLERGRAAGLDANEQRELTSLRVRYRRLFNTRPDVAEALLFRLALADPPTARSLRRRLDDLLTFR